MAYKLTASQDLNQSKFRSDSYRFHIETTDEQLSDLEQHGPVYNGNLSYTGVFKTPKDALKAAKSFYNGDGELALFEVTAAYFSEDFIIAEKSKRNYLRKRYDGCLRIAK